ncbi:hypothetical protein ACH437_23840 [Streptomyces xinghaiensis]|uniref:hypothetical protein n=1 Tax=Streptomyces xinghaiensis TaxID=1038928 RepID=UPI0037B41F10
MTDPTTRRGYLLAALRAHGGPVTTCGAVQLMAGSPWPTTGRNTARKDLRALAAHGYLRPAAGSGSYLPVPTSSPESSA